MTDGSRVTRWKEFWTICGFGLALSLTGCEGFSVDEGGGGRWDSPSSIFVAIPYVLGVFESAVASKIRAWTMLRMSWPWKPPTGNGSGNERHDQLSFGFPVFPQARRCGPSPSRQLWTRGWETEDENRGV